MSLPMSFILILALTTSLFLPIFSTSRQNYKTESDAKIGFQMTLKHVDSDRKFTKLELLQRSFMRGRKRMRKLYSTSLSASPPSIDAPVHFGNGEYLMELSIGTPPVAYYAIFDTGIDLIWTQCEPCQQCITQGNPLFDRRKSSSFSPLPCSSNLCEAIANSTCDNNNCDLGDDTWTQVLNLATETFTFNGVSVPNVGFFCVLNDNEGSGFVQNLGLVGMGRGLFSLVSQLDEPMFSYCLTTFGSNKTSTLLMGSKANNHNTPEESIKITTLFKNPTMPSFYYISLEGITVGDTRLSIPKSTFALKSDGTGGMIIDSSTSITLLEHSAYDVFSEEFTNQIKLPIDGSFPREQPLCFIMPPGSEEIEVPKLVFHFEGADLELPKDNYFIVDTEIGFACLAIGGSDGMSLFGSIQQQNILVVHDLVQETISFAPTQCDQL